MFLNYIGGRVCAAVLLTILKWEGEAEVSNMMGDIAVYNMINFMEEEEDVDETVLECGDHEFSIMSVVPICVLVSDS